MTYHGSPCWYELTTADTAASQAFYGPILGWTFRDSGMQGFTYTLGCAGEAMVSGLYAPMEGMGEYWVIYFAVEDVDATCARVPALGGTICMEPADIPNVGRFAVVADPLGATFCLLQPLDGQMSQAFDQMKSGHGNWHELMVADPVAAMGFYGALLGWTPSTVMPMGEMGNYHLIGWQGRDIGGMMGLPAPEVPPNWLPYFGVPSIKAAMAQIAAGGGSVEMGPMEVPGGAFVCQAKDPRGVWFALVGGA